MSSDHEQLQRADYPVLNLLKDNNILVALLPPNTTDRLQLMDILVNKPAKEYLKEEVGTVVCRASDAATGWKRT